MLYSWNWIGIFGTLCVVPRSITYSLFVIHNGSRCNIYKPTMLIIGEDDQAPWNCINVFPLLSTYSYFDKVSKNYWIWKACLKKTQHTKSLLGKKSLKLSEVVRTICTRIWTLDEKSALMLSISSVSTKLYNKVILIFFNFEILNSLCSLEFNIHAHIRKKIAKMFWCN